MVTEKGLATTEQKPEEVVLWGRNAAIQLQAIVSSRDKKLIMGGKQYLFFEDWQTIAKFYGVTAKVVDTQEIRDNDKLIGFLARAVAIVKGEEISAADAECVYDEPNWRDKPRFQLRSMAQTRSCAKALRNCLGWVAVLAGYEATPAEEMADVKLDEPKGHYCSVHKTVFFKKGKMPGYAHKIEGTNKWCNENEDKQTKEQVIAQAEKDIKDYWGQEEAKPQPETTPVALGGKSSPVAEPTGDNVLIDTSWDVIRPNLTQLYQKKEGWITIKQILDKLEELGADISSGKIQTSYECLDEANKLKFVWMMNEARKGDKT